MHGHDKGGENLCNHMVKHCTLGINLRQDCAREWPRVDQLIWRWDKSMGVLNDTVQLEARSEKIWSKRCNCSNRQVDAITHDGHLDSNGSKQTHTRGSSECIVFALVCEREANWNNKRKGMHWQSSTASIYVNPQMVTNSILERGVPIWEFWNLPAHFHTWSSHVERGAVVLAAHWVTQRQLVTGWETNASAWNRKQQILMWKWWIPISTWEFKTYDFPFPYGDHQMERVGSKS